MAHGTRINGTSYGITGGKCLVGGTVYKIEKGTTLVNGTKREITFMKPTTVTIKAIKTYLSNIYINDVFQELDSGTTVTQTFEAGINVKIRAECEGNITVNGVPIEGGFLNIYETDVTGKTCIIEQNPHVYITIS